MDESTTVPIVGPSALIGGPLTDVLRRGARASLARAIEAEVASDLQRRAHLKDESGRYQAVRNGYPPERTARTGIGPAEVERPRVRGRRPADRREASGSAILPPYLRKTKSPEDLIPGLSPKGVSTGDFTDALRALLGPDAPGLSAATATRLKAAWEAEDDACSRRPLEGEHDVSIRADGVPFSIRLGEGRRCIPVLMGATADGQEELIAAADGYRESERSWKEGPLDVKARGPAIDPALAIGGGALGFREAVHQGWPTCKARRGRVHKTANAPDKLPKGVQPRAEAALHESYEAEGREGAGRAFNRFAAAYEAKYPEAVGRLAKDRGALLVSDEFPAEHGRPIRATDPIESRFATVRPRHGRTKGSGSRVARLTTVFKLREAASKKWRLLNGSGRLKDVIRGAKLVDGIEVKGAA